MTLEYTAVSTKVVPQKRYSVRDNAEWSYGYKEFGVDWLRFTTFTNKKREGINRFVCDASLYVAKTSKASIKYHKPPLPIIPCGIVAYGFVGQPFSKQLYLDVIV